MSWQPTLLTNTTSPIDIVDSLACLNEDVLQSMQLLHDWNPEFQVHTVIDIYGLHYISFELGGKDLQFDLLESELVMFYEGGKYIGQYLNPDYSPAKTLYSIITKGS